jgi:cell division septal protein FtsQ
MFCGNKKAGQKIMFRANDKEPKRKLKKQPPMQRAYSGSATAVPKLVAPPRTQERVQRRRRQQAQQTLTMPLHWLKEIVFSARWLSLALLVTAVYALYTIGQQPSYHITQAPIEGLYAIPASELLAHSGIIGQHIFGIDPEQAAANIIKTPGITAATVEIRWPNQARITVQEETPVAVVRQGEQVLWVNEAGELLPARLDLPELLHITADESLLLGYEAETQGAEVTGKIDTAVLLGAQQLHTLLPEQTTFRYHPQHGLIYDTPEGWAVFLGTGEDMHQKLAIYQAILRELQAQNLRPEYISVSNQQKPFYKAMSN